MRDDRRTSLLDELAAYARERHGDGAVVMVDLGMHSASASIADGATQTPLAGTRRTAGSPGGALRMLGAQYLRGRP